MLNESFNPHYHRHLYYYCYLAIASALVGDYFVLAQRLQFRQRYYEQARWLLGSWKLLLAA